MYNIKEIADAAGVIVIEAMHVHASDRKLTEAGSAKLFCEKDGETTIENEGQLTDREIRMVREFIKENYKEMYMNGQKKVIMDFMENKEFFRCENICKRIRKFPVCKLQGR